MDLHREGINLRHMVAATKSRLTVTHSQGLVRKHAQTPVLKRLLLIEMLARLVKTVLHKKWRLQMKKSLTPSEEPCKVRALYFTRIHQASISALIERWLHVNI